MDSVLPSVDIPFLGDVFTVGLDAWGRALPVLVRRADALWAGDLDLGGVWDAV